MNSIEVIKSGIADSFQDDGRFGFQNVGINPGGTMDVIAMNVANALVGNKLNEAVLEMCFPASTLLFKEATLIALSGADFGCTVNNIPIPIHHPVLIPASSEVKFKKHKHGRYGYIAVQGGFQLEDWLGSKSTHSKVGTGGWEGRMLKKTDVVPLNTSEHSISELKIFPWLANVNEFYRTSTVRFLEGNEFALLAKTSMKDFLKKPFTVSLQSDRMGFRLEGVELKTMNKEELVSTGVTFGTVQLLPSGQLIILMADHQTTGGYPRVANVISADRSSLVQHKPGSEVRFESVSMEDAEETLLKQETSMKQLQVSCRLKLKDVNSY